MIHHMFPYLRVTGAAAAIDFYRAAFGATEIFRLVEPTGRIGHTELKMGDAVLMLSEAFPEFGLYAPDAGTTPGCCIHLHVDNCDDTVAAAVRAGATVQMPPTDQFYGERSSRLLDPFGHQWLIGHEIEKMEPQEMQRRYDLLFASGDV